MIIDDAGVVTAAVDGRVAVMTGAGRGIERETARILGHVGACVVVAKIDGTHQDTERMIRS